MADRKCLGNCQEESISSKMCNSGPAKEGHHWCINEDRALVVKLMSSIPVGCRAVVESGGNQVH